MGLRELVSVDSINSGCTVLHVVDLSHTMFPASSCLLREQGIASHRLSAYSCSTRTGLCLISKLMPTAISNIEVNIRR